jgi:hypothetical protein
MSSQPLQQPSDDLRKFNKNVFYVVHADGKEEVVIANNEDEIVGATLVISLEEVEQIRERLVATLEAVAAADLPDPVPQTQPA